MTSHDSDFDVDVVSDMSAFPSGEADAVLVLGKAGQLLLEEEKVIPKGRKTSTLRNKLWRRGLSSPPILFSYSLGVRDIEYSWFVDLQCDVKLAVRVAKTGKLEPDLGEYRYVKRFSALWCYVNDLYTNVQPNKPVEVSFDTETLGLDPYNPSAYIVALQFSAKVGTADVVRFGSREEMQEAANDIEFMEPLANLVQSKKVSLRAANGKYDCNWLHRHFNLEVTNFKFDTTLVGSLLDENRSNSLDVHAKVYTSELGGYSDEFDATVDKARMDLVPPEKLLIYAGGDADATLRVSKVEKRALMADARLANFYINLLHPAARAYEKVERAGVLVDLDRFKRLEKDLREAMAKSVAEVKKVVGGRLVAKHLVDSNNITKASFLVDFMFSPMGLNLKPKQTTEKSKQPSTSLDHLLQFDGVPEAKEFLRCIKDYQTASKTLNTYVTGFLTHLRSDCRFHPSYYLHRGNREDKEGGTNTGRLSCRDPAYQTIPKHTVWAQRIRECYIAPPGFVILAFDYSQGELRVIACIADEPMMIEAYANNMDLHAMTAGRFRGYSYEQMVELEKTNEPLYKSIRQLGKAGNFGLIYGMGVNGFIVYAELNYKVKLSTEEAASFRDGFFTNYAQLPVYHARYKEMARQHGFVRTPLGRVRHLPLISSPNKEVAAKSERQSINSPVQATLSDMSLLATAEMDRRGWLEYAPVMGMVHDQLLMYCPEDRVIEHAKQVKELMENLPFHKFGWKPQLKFPVDCEIGKDMAALKKTKL